MSLAATTGELMALLSAKYAMPAFAFVTEIPNATSVSKSRSCDAMAFGCWKSKGVTINGFELKTSRSDWLRELQDRHKALEFERHCHHWWIVATPKVVKIEELPAEWGLLEAIPGDLKVRSAASFREPEPMPTSMIAALMRRALGVSPERQALRDAYNRGHRDGQAGLTEAVNKVHECYTNGMVLKESRLSESIQRFEAASGVKIDEYNGLRVGKAFAEFMKLPRGHMPGRLSMSALRELCKSFDEFEAAWRAEFGGAE